MLISPFWCRDKARRWVPPLNTQCLKNSTESGKRSVIALGSLCLPSTAWSRLLLYILTVFNPQHIRSFDESGSKALFRMIDATVQLTEGGQSGCAHPNNEIFVLKIIVIWNLSVKDLKKIDFYNTYSIFSTLSDPSHDKILNINNYIYIYNFYKYHVLIIW